VDKKTNKNEFREIFLKIRKHWYYFAIATAVCLFLAVIKIITSQKTYQVETTLLVGAVSTGSKAPKEILDALEIQDKTINIEDKIGLLQSSSMVQRATQQVDFTVSYSIIPNHALNYIGELMVQQVPKSNFPLAIQPDFNHPQVTGIRLCIEPVDSTTYLLKYELQDENWVYNYQSDTYTAKYGSKSVSGTFYYGSTLTTPYFRFSVNRVTGMKLDPGASYCFVFNNPKSVMLNYQSKIDVEPISRESRILRVTSTGPVVENEIDFLNSLVDVFINYDLERKNQIGKNTIRFIDSQLLNISDSLQRAERALEGYRSRNRIVDINYVSGSIMEKLDRLENERIELTLALSSYNEILNYLRNENMQSSSVLPTFSGVEENSILNSLLIEYNDLSRQRAGLEVSANEGNPMMTIVDEKIRNVKASLIENITSMQRNSRTQLNYVNQRINDLEQNMVRLPQNERQLTGLERKFDFNDKTYDLLLEKRTEAAIEYATNTSDIEVVDRAKLSSDVPVTPKTKFYLVLSIFLGVIIPGAFIALKEILNVKVKSVDQLKTLTEIPIIGEIIYDKSIKNKLVSGKNLAQLPIAENFRFLNVNLQFIKKSEQSRNIIIVSSSRSGEGKSFCSSNLASTVASSGKRTLLIDADMRMAKLAGIFGVNQTDRGLSTYLAGAHELDKVLSRDVIRNLDLIVAGPVPPNPVDLMNNSMFELLVEQVGESYDQIIIDTPPIGIVSEFFVVSRYSTVNLIVVRQNLTTISEIDLLNEMVENERIENIGLVYNGRDTMPKKYYGQYRKHAGSKGFQDLKNKIIKTKEEDALLDV